MLYWVTIGTVCRPWQGINIIGPKKVSAKSGHVGARIVMLKCKARMLMKHGNDYRTKNLIYIASGV